MPIRHVQDYARHGLRFQLAHAYLVSAQSGKQLLLLQEFDEYGRVTNSVDRNAVATYTDYDFLDRVTRRWVYGNSGRLESGKEAFVYDARGLTNYFDPLSRLTTFVRDAAGRELYETNANHEVLRFAYDPADDLLSLTDGKSHTTSWKYDSYGQTTNKVDANNAEMFRYQYDPNGRLTNRWQAGNVVTTYRYDPLGNLTNIVYPASTHSVALQYDPLNRLTNLVDGVGTTAFTWTDGDQLASEAGPWLNSTVSYTHENRLRAGLSLQQPAAGAWSQSYGYDEFGRLTSVTSAAGAFGYQYKQCWSGNGPTAADLVQRLTLPNRRYSSRSYDDLGRLLSSTLGLADAITQSWPGGLWSGGVMDYHGYHYDLGSQRTQQVFTAGNYVNYSFDNIGQLQSAKGFEAYQTPRPHEQFGYGYDAAWNLYWRTNNDLVLNFGVNPLNELTTSSRTANSKLTVAGVTSLQATNVTVNRAAAQRYSDNTFAQEGKNLTNGNNTFVAQAADAQGDTASNTVSVWLPASVTYTYDLRGNLTSDGLRTFAYDAENQLTNVTVANAWKSDFAYDGLMRRRIRTESTWSGTTWVPTNEVHYVYDGRVVVQERDASNFPQVTYTRGTDLGGGFESAGGIGGLLARTDNPQMAHAFYHCDGNGNVTCLMDSSGGVVARYAYDPFGNILAMSGVLANANLYRFSSKECHPNSGLLYYLYRYFDPNLQRWLNRDPIDEEADVNLYRFVSNEPLKSVDVDGLQCIMEVPYALFARPTIPRPLLEQAIRLNRGSARIRLPDGRKLDLFDKGGKGHFDKATQLRVPTPHVHEPAPPQFAPRFLEWTRPAALGDMLDGIIQLKGSLAVPACSNCGHNAPPAQVTAPPGTPVPLNLKQESPKHEILPGCVEA